MELTLSDLAIIDLANIFNYTIDVWGERQAYRYQELIDNGLAAIAENPTLVLSKDANKYFPQARSLKVEKHYIYYVVEDDEIVILRILHQSMNPELHF